jgi:UDP-glucose 4-epimerase
MILVTGSQGFIGSHLMKQIPSALGIDKRDNGHKQNLYLCDLLEKNALFWAIHDNKIDTVFHLAAMPSVPDSYNFPMKSYYNNVSASINLIDACVQCGVKKFIFASSSSVKGNSPYGHSKKFIEELLDKSGLNYTVLRYFNVFGNGQRNNIVKIMIDKLKANEEIVIFGDGKTSRDFTHVSNVVKANFKALDSKYDNRVFEVGTGKSYTLLELYEKLKANYNPWHKKLSFADERIGDIKYSKADTILSENEIVHLDEGISLCE